MAPERATNRSALATLLYVYACMHFRENHVGSHASVMGGCAGEGEGEESPVCCICHEELAPLESIQEEEEEETVEEREEGGESSDVSEVLDCDHKVRHL